MTKTIARKIIVMNKVRERKIRLNDLKEGNFLNNIGFLELIDKAYSHQEIKFINTLKRNETDKRIIEKIYSVGYNDKEIVSLIFPVSVKYVKEENSNDSIIYNELNSKLKEAGL